MGTRARFALAAVAVAGLAVVGLAFSRSAPPKPQQPFPSQCLDIPAAIEMPRWYPKDLPLPEGSFATQEFDETAGVNRLLLVAEASLDDFVVFVLREWPEAGWTLGAGEREPGEAEDTFLKSKDRFGKFRARSVFCEEARTQLLLELVLDGRNLPTPGAS